MLIRLLTLLFVCLPLVARAQMVPPEHVHSIVYSPHGAAWHEAERQAAEREGLDIKFLGGRGASPQPSPPPSSCPATGTQYYVSASLAGASDLNNGLFPTFQGGLNGPWQSLAKVNSPGLNFTANQCVNLYTPDTFAGCVVFKTGVNVSGSSKTSMMYVWTYGPAGAPTINSTCPGDQTAAFTIDGVSGITVAPLIVSAHGTMTQYGFLLINSGGSASDTVILQEPDVSGFWTNINTNGSTAAEIYYSGGYGAGGVNNIQIINPVLHGAAGVASQDDAGIVGNNANQNMTNIVITGADIFNMGSLPGGCNGSSQCPGRGEGILIDGVNGATLSHIRIHDIGANVNTCGGSSGLETYASNNVLADWVEIYNERPLNGVYPGAGCDWDAADQDDGSTNVTFQHFYTHNNGGAGVLRHMGAVGSFGWHGNHVRYWISENDDTLGSQVGGGFASLTYSGQGLGTATASDYNNTIYQANAGAFGPYAAIGFVGTSTLTAGSFLANNAIVLTGSNVPYVCLNYNGGNLSLSPVTFKTDGYSGGTFNVTGCNSGTVTSFAAWAAVATGGDAGSTLLSPGFAGTPPFGNLTWNPATQTGSLPGPAGYEPTASAYINTGTNLTASPYSQTPPPTDYAGATIPTGVGTGYPIGADVGIPSASQSVVSVTCTPATGLLTSTSGSNTASCAILFTGSVTAAGSNVLALSQGTSCPIATGTGVTLTASCTFTGGQNTPLAANQVYLATAATNAISGGTIMQGTVPANLAAANGIIFTGLQVQTAGFYVIKATGSDSNPCTVAAPCASFTHVQTLMQSGNKITYVEDTGGNYSFVGAASTCSGTPIVFNNPGSPSGALFYSGTGITYLCLGIADTNTAYLAFPNQHPVVDGGTSANNLFGFTFGTSPSSIGPNLTFNGIEWLNYAGVLTGINAGNITIANSKGVNLRSRNYSASFCGPTGTNSSNCQYDSESFLYLRAGWGTVSLINNLGTASNGSYFAISDGVGDVGARGPLTLSKNIWLNGCAAVNDCGSVEIYDNSHSLAHQTCSMDAEIIGGYGVTGAPYSNQDKAYYFDDYTSGCAVTNPQIYGAGQFALQIHGGSLDTFVNGFIDLSSVSSDCTGGCSANNATLGYYVQSSLAASATNDGYTGAMNGNAFQHMIVINTSATAPPPFMWVWSNNGSVGRTPNYPPQNNPAFGGNDYWTATGGWNSCANGLVGGGSSNCEFSDGSNVTTNPGATFTTDAYGAHHYVFSAAPSGFNPFPKGQGPN